MARAGLNPLKEHPSFCKMRLRHFLQGVYYNFTVWNLWTIAYARVTQLADRGPSPDLSSVRSGPRPGSDFGYIRASVYSQL